MLLIRTSAIALMLLPNASMAEGAQCPSTSGKNPLSSVTIYDGPPAEMASLAPDSSTKAKGGGTQSSWEVKYIFDAGRKLFVECNFGPASKPILLDVPPVKVCMYSTNNKVSSLVCK